MSTNFWRGFSACLCKGITLLLFHKAYKISRSMTSTLVAQYRPPQQGRPGEVRGEEVDETQRVPPDRRKFDVRVRANSDTNIDAATLERALECTRRISRSDETHSRDRRCIIDTTGQDDVNTCKRRRSGQA